MPRVAQRCAVEQRAVPLGSQPAEPTCGDPPGAVLGNQLIGIIAPGRLGVVVRAVDQQAMTRDNVSEAGYPAFVRGDVVIAHLVLGAVEPRLARAHPRDPLVRRQLFRRAAVPGGEVEPHPLGKDRTVEIPVAGIDAQRVAVLDAGDRRAPRQLGGSRRGWAQNFAPNSIP